jgi:hypothetical protein
MPISLSVITPAAVNRPTQFTLLIKSKNSMNQHPSCANKVRLIIWLPQGRHVKLDFVEFNQKLLRFGDCFQSEKGIPIHVLLFGTKSFLN